MILSALALSMFVGSDAAGLRAEHCPDEAKAFVGLVARDGSGAVVGRQWLRTCDRHEVL